MFFRRVNSKTIRCIISEQDMLQSGIRLDDIFERKQKAIDFIKGIISKAVEAENFQLSAEAASMKITVMPDRAISLTLSMDPHESPEDAILEAHTQDLYIYRFADIRRLMQCCRHMCGSRPLDSSLYMDRDKGEYYLFIMRTEGVVDYERIVLSANEFGELVTSSAQMGAAIREHMECLMEKNAISILAGI